MTDSTREDGPRDEEQQDQPEGIELTMTDSDNTFEPEEADKAVEPSDEGSGRS